MQHSKVLLAYSGGLDTSVILHWLQQEKGCEVVCYLADLGQEDEISSAVERAHLLGASEVICDDLKEVFCRDFIWPLLRSGALYEARYLMGTSIARPAIVEGMVLAARKKGCQAIVHGATGKGNDQIRFEFGVASLAPDLEVIAPWRSWDIKGREDCLEYVKEHQIPLQFDGEKAYSMDANLMHISYEGKMLEELDKAPPASMWRWTKDPTKASPEGRTVEIEFLKGEPIAVDGVKGTPFELLSRCNELACEQGVGRIDMVENRFLGLKSRGCYETPGYTLLFEAMRVLEEVTLDRDSFRVRERLGTEYADLVYNGFWFAPARKMIQSAFDECAKVVSGKVVLHLVQGRIEVKERASDNSLYHPQEVSFETNTQHLGAQATGFIQCHQRQIRSWSRLEVHQDGR